MKLVLLCGGSGTRLWPLSTGVQAKQFLRVLKNSQGEDESLLERMVRQIEAAGLLDHTFIATVQPQAELINTQVKGRIPLIVEPEGRDTFPSVALACAYLRDITGVSPDEVICVSPVDLYVDDAFFQTIRKAERALQETGCDMAMVGIPPAYPAVKYGYIVPEMEADSTQAYRRVKRFTEKPKREQAEQLIARQALWNSGVFCLPLRFLLQLLAERDLPVRYEPLRDAFEQLPKISFDYEVAESITSAAVVVHNGMWNDLGTWDTLTEKMGTPVIGKGILSDDSTNTSILNYLDIPVIVVGLPDAVVVVNENGILVSDKANSGRLKDFLPLVKE
ncbi:sugar phosphate nucleotidyltransferase [Brevibacillus sp. B_LB10_24]|uniref:sugar phosphate nucleotidyltransferase n=1 Tax=Brevibacillus sp. B_LB10_24 TaxID=3380645 RepID=UPI0038B7A82C